LTLTAKLWRRMEECRSFLSSALDIRMWSASGPVALTSRKNPGSY
jgi:hypothetical protein